MSLLLLDATVWEWTDVEYKGKATPHSWVSVSKEGWIDAVGTSSSTPPQSGSYDKVISLEGALVIPGLQDAHVHVSAVGQSQYFLDLDECKSISDLQLLVKEHAIKHPELSVLIGVNWDQKKLGRYPNRFDIDSVCSDKPVFLWRACWHIGLCNTKLLSQINVLPKEGEKVSSYDIAGGVIEVDRGTSLPTGILKEKACELVTHGVLARKTDAEEKQFIKDGLDLCLRGGLTSVQTNDESSLLLYKSLVAEDDLNIRVFLTPCYTDLKKPVAEGGIQNVPPHRPESFKVEGNEKNVPKTIVNSPESKLIVERVKIFSDGSLGAETAAIRKSLPSETGFNKENFNGVLIQRPDELTSMVQDAKKCGYRLEVHAIGDAAADSVLDAFENAGLTASDRPVLTHCQILWSDLISRMARNGVVANVQPSFVPTDMKWVSDRLSTEHQSFAYVWKTLLENGVAVAGGSDSPIETVNPFVGLYDAIYRRSRDDKDAVFKPEEKLSFSEALWTYTVGASICSKTENILGKIQRGYIGDLVVVDRSILEDNEILKDVEPRFVIVGGKVVYSNLGSSKLTEKKMDGPFAYGKNGPRPSAPPQWTMNKSRILPSTDCCESCSCHLLATCLGSSGRGKSAQSLQLLKKLL